MNFLKKSGQLLMFLAVFLIIAGVIWYLFGYLAGNDGMDGGTLVEVTEGMVCL